MGADDTGRDAAGPPAFPRVLLIGYGNPGRLDDGLGPRLAERIEALGLPGVRVDSLYQLSVEQAAEAAGHDVVIFADAACAGPEPFYLEPVRPGDPTGFTTHSVSPTGVMALCASCFGARPRAFVLGIRGYAFNEFGEVLSAAAEANLRQAAEFLERLLRDGCRSLPDGTGPKDAGG